jgi:hypothetical protein
MQMFDQEVATSRTIAEQFLDLVQSLRIDLATLRRRFGPLATRARVLECADLVQCIMIHEQSRLDIRVTAE